LAFDPAKVFSHCLPTTVVKSSKGQPSTSTSKEIEIDVDRSLKRAADGGGGRASRPGSTADPSFGL
jgi:hypothetical protein